jgi:hypothetical protein
VKTFEIELQYTDRDKGPGTSVGKVKVETSSLATAVAKGVRTIMKGATDRKVRFDMLKSGVTIHASVAGEAVEQPEAAAAQA